MDLEWTKLNLKAHKWPEIIVGLTLVLASGFFYYFWTRGEVSTDDAFVDGHIFIITPRVSGYLTQVLVTDNQLVRQGQPLITLDRTPYEVALGQARANLAESRFTLTSLELGVPLQLIQTAEQVKGARLS